LLLESSLDAQELDERIATRFATAFTRGSVAGLLQLAAGEAGHTLPPLS